MTLDPHIDDARFEAALDAWLDETATDEDFAALDALLAADPANARMLLDLAIVQQGLSQNSDLAGRTAEPPLPLKPVLSAPGAPRAKVRVSGLSAFAYAAAALLIAAAAVAVYLVAFNSEPETQNAKPGQTVATVVDMTDDSMLIVNDDVALPGQSVSAGEVALDAGSAEFILANRVKVNLKGKTRLMMHDPIRVSLARGQAEFDVPHGVTGFTVLLPDGSRIVDLGTAFRVEVDEAGEVKLRVTEGKVEWVAAEGAPGAGAKPVVVAAAQSARMVDGRPVVAVVTNHFAAITARASAPSIDADDIANLGEPTGRDKWWVHSNVPAGRAKGQTFTTGDRDVLLRSVTLRTTGASMPTKTFAIRIGTITDARFAALATAAATQDTPWNAGDYVTWTLEPPVRLDASTVYAIDAGMTGSTTGWQTGIPYLAYTADDYAGGERYQSGQREPGIGDQTVEPLRGDLVFHLDLIAAQETTAEPSSSNANSTHTRKP